jgi:hypothetical protein
MGKFPSSQPPILETETFWLRGVVVEGLANTPSTSRESGP